MVTRHFFRHDDSQKGFNGESLHNVLSEAAEPMRIVLRIGGSIVASPANPELIKKYVDLLRNLKTQGHVVATVVGGGTLARELIQVGKKLGLTEEAQDDLAISVSRLFAQLFLKQLRELGCGIVPLTIEDAARCVHEGKIMVMGGLKSGMTTDNVAALVAENIEADLYVKATDQEGVYSKDPKKHSDAIKLDHMRFSELSQALAEDKHKAGMHQILDPKAVKLLMKAGAKVIVVNGNKPENVLLAINGENIGTTIE